MSYWVCCNSCFLSPSPERKLAVTSCGHVICSVCYQKGNHGRCLICSSQCQVSPLSDKSGSDVKALFSDIGVVATRHLTEISKVITFQTRHQKRLLNYYKQRNQKLEELLVKMKQEMQQMAKTLNEQSAYISKLENVLHHHSLKPSSVSQISSSPQTPHGNKDVFQIPYNSSVFLPRHASSTNLSESMEGDERSLFRKPNSGPRLSVMKPPQEGIMGTISHRSYNQNPGTSHCAHSAIVSRFPATPSTPKSHSQSSVWKSPIFKPPSSFRHSMSSLGFPPS
ncbi:probable E3 SUMO-protein ligase RNF212 isoform X1 [Girardinichthys multiradiatus]|uniref:probable E3 SUMO-protein ligase RNF212 isoform X1 n=1 Tax=Girardinichthys multiradiatus TaxID=208333 RepID=UPI001FACE333|nr:probable E3 SUMO-protein ligase RNF212 isoform X1 [Girardinichthys multiradiatus]